MPILEVTTTSIKQQCLNCQATHMVPLKQGYSKSKKGPFALVDGDTLEVKVDKEASAQSVTLVASDFKDIGNASATEIVAKLNAMLSGAAADVDEEAVRLVSNSSTMGTTALEVTGGTARAKLGFDGREYGPRCLGVTKGQSPHQRTENNTIDLPHCPECQAKECLVRTWDQCPSGHEEAFFAKHRACVNALAQYLKTEGYSDPEAVTAHNTESAAPPDLDAAFPPGPMTLPSIAATAGSEGGS